MKIPSPDPEDRDDPLSAELRCDATRMPEPPFDAALHRETVQRIWGLSESREGTWWCRPTLAALAVFMVMALGLGLWLPQAPWSTAHRPINSPDFSGALASIQSAVARLSPSEAEPIPAWMSPTASLLDFPFNTKPAL